MRSDLQELRELVEKDPLDIFYYRPWASMVKAGDLLLYSGSGPVETMTKVGRADPASSLPTRPTPASA